MSSTILEDGGWIKEEFTGAEFGDRRLSERLQAIAAAASRHPSWPINHAAEDWAASKASYRFFQNPRVHPEQILYPHFKNTAQRAVQHQEIIVVQDTSALDFSSHKQTDDLGFIGKMEDGYAIGGLFLHATMAMTSEGVPLGLLDENIWARHGQKIKGHEHTKVPMEEKESFRWVEGLRAAQQHLSGASNVHVTLVCDREADIYELFEEAIVNKIDIVVRLQHDRILYDEEIGDYIHVFDRLGLEKTRGRVNVEVPGTGKRQPRVAELEIRFAKVTLAAQPRGVNTARVSKRHDLQLYVVDLREVGVTPDGEKPLVWTLYTTLPVHSGKDALEIMRIYKLRWVIELYFKSLKTGCSVEKCRLETAQRLMNYASVLSVVAWRLVWMTFVGRKDPSANAQIVITNIEWKTLWILHHRRKIRNGEMTADPPKEMPTVNEVIRWIAMLGGFLGRKGDKNPGQITIWRGWLRLMGGVEMFEALRPKRKNKTHNESCG